MAHANSRKVTQHLRELGAESETILNDGSVLTKAEVMARLLWKYALGWTDVSVDKENGQRIKEVHPPAQWAIEMVYNRLEGRVPQQIVDDSTVLTAAKRVSELARERLNIAAEAAVAVSEVHEPVDRSGDGAESSKEADREPPVADETA